MEIHKISDGFVRQVFNSETGELIRQSFIAFNSELEYSSGERITDENSEYNDFYHPFNMIQPEIVKDSEENRPPPGWIGLSLED